MERFLWICLGGAIGTGARYLVSVGMLRWFGSAFPFGTFVVNVLGSFALGLLVQLGASAEWTSPTLRLALTTGLLGGFTTYSTFSYETMGLLQEKAWSTAGLNVALTVTVCLTASFLGFGLGRWLTRG